MWNNLQTFNFTRNHCLTWQEALQDGLCLHTVMPIRDRRSRNARLPIFRCRFAVPISRCRTPLPLRISMSNGTEFSYVILTEQTTEFYNGRTAKRQWKDGNGMVETGHKSATPVRQDQGIALSVRTPCKALYVSTEILHFTRSHPLPLQKTCISSIWKSKLWKSGAAVAPNAWYSYATCLINNWICSLSISHQTAKER